jgi:diguanylate cyclase (GGDEF)-like protein
MFPQARTHRGRCRPRVLEPSRLELSSAVNDTFEVSVSGQFFLGGLVLSDRDVAQRLPEQLEKDIKALDWRDLQLWGICACVLFAVAAGFVLLLAPKLLWQFSDCAPSANLPQYTWALIALLVLLNAQTLHQRVRLQKTRAELIRQLQIAERAAQLDSLTGVFNRRYMDEMLAKEVSRSERYQTGLCVAVIDVDRFKEFNTRFGHLEGDRVLMAVASLLCRNFRAADTVVRYGGDEFIVVMPETNLHQATVAVQRLHKLYLAQWNRANGDCGYSITVTCGVAEFKAGMTADKLIHQADRLMLDAKLDGMPEEAVVRQ